MKTFLRNVRGAPFKIGEKIKVVKRTDDTVSSRFIGRKGTVIYFDFACGCGQSYPKDPMIGVLFSRGTVEEFWQEEISRTNS